MDCTWEVDEKKDRLSDTKIKHLEHGTVSLATYNLAVYKKSKNARWNCSQECETIGTPRRDGRVDPYQGWDEKKLHTCRIEMQLEEWKLQIEDMARKQRELLAKIKQLEQKQKDAQKYLVQKIALAASANSACAPLNVSASASLT